MRVSSKEFEDYTQMYLTFNNFQIQYRIKKSKKNYEKIYFFLGLGVLIFTVMLAIVCDCLTVRGIL